MPKPKHRPTIFLLTSLLCHYSKSLPKERRHTAQKWIVTGFNNFDTIVKILTAIFNFNALFCIIVINKALFAVTRVRIADLWTRVRLWILIGTAFATVDAAACLSVGITTTWCWKMGIVIIDAKLPCVGGRVNKIWHHLLYSLGYRSLIILNLLNCVRQLTYQSWRLYRIVSLFYREEYNYLIT